MIHDRSRLSCRSCRAKAASRLTRLLRQAELKAELIVPSARRLCDLANGAGDIPVMTIGALASSWPPASSSRLQSSLRKDGSSETSTCTEARGFPARNLRTRLSVSRSATIASVRCGICARRGWKRKGSIFGETSQVQQGSGIAGLRRPWHTKRMLPEDLLQRANYCVTVAANGLGVLLARMRSLNWRQCGKGSQSKSKRASDLDPSIARGAINNILRVFSEGFAIAPSLPSPPG